MPSRMQGVPDPHSMMLVIEQLRRRFLVPAALVAAAMAGVCFPVNRVHAQTNLSDTSRVSDEVKEKLLRPGDLTLRDMDLVQALFSIKRAWGLNIVADNSTAKGETLNVDFEDVPLHEILDSILTPRGFGYKVVGNTLIVVKSETLGSFKPLFKTETIPVAHADLTEIRDAVQLYLSNGGTVQVVASAKRLLVNDFPDRIEMIRARIEELDAAAGEALAAQRQEDEQAAVREQRNQAIANGASPGAAGGVLMPIENKIAVVDLDYTKADVLAPALQPLVLPGGQVTVAPKENKLIVSTTADRLEHVIETIKQLDVPRAQVRISALIYDASLDDVRRIGVNWNATGKGRNVDSQGVAQDSIGIGALTAAAPAATAPNGVFSLASLGTNFDIRMAINALATSRQSRLLANPSVTVYDQEDANIAIVQEVPFQQLTQGLGGGSIGTTAFREAGVALRVNPIVSRDSTILMTVNPKFSVLTGFTPSNAPIIDRRETTTVIRVQDQGTIVLGGLRQRNSTRNNSGVPFLKDVKLLGELFKHRDSNARETELVVFLTPEIIPLPVVMDDRRQIVYDASRYSLERIPYPRIPLDPCKPDDWKHRCGFPGCHGCDKCDGPRADDSGLYGAPYVPPYSSVAEPGMMWYDGVPVEAAAPSLPSHIKNAPMLNDPPVPPVVVPPPSTDGEILNEQPVPLPSARRKSPARDTQAAINSKNVARLASFEDTEEMPPPSRVAKPSATPQSKRTSPSVKSATPPAPAVPQAAPPRGRIIRGYADPDSRIQREDIEAE